MSDRDQQAELRQLAHDVRNALNGVAVNLEVARSRAQRNASIAQIAPFIETAAQQLDAATRLHKRYTDVASALAGAFNSGARTGARTGDRPAEPTADDTLSRSENH